MALPDLPCDGGGAPIRACVGPYMLLLSPLGKSLPLLTQTHKSALSNDDVIQDVYPHQPAGCTELLSNQHIVAAGLRVAGGVVVDDDDAGGAVADGLLEHLPRVHRG